VCLLHAAAPVVRCILCVSSAVLRTGCRVQCFAHAAGCALPAARRTRNAAVLCVPCFISHVLASSCMSSAVCCTLSVWFCRLLRGVCCMPRVACCLVALLPVGNGLFQNSCCMPHVARSMLHVALHDGVVRCMLLEVWRMLPVLLRVAFLLFAAYCPLHAARCHEVVCCTLQCRWLHFPRRMLRVICHIFPDAGCMLSMVCCTISSGRLRHAVRWIVSTCPFFVACRTFSVACCLLPVAGTSVPCAWCALSVAWSHVASRHVACYALRVVCCTLLTAPSVLRVVSCPVVHVVCRTPPVACRRVAQRCHTRSASRRRSQLSASVAVEARCSADRGARACVRACMPACG
jgi:hypothetical protein